MNFNTLLYRFGLDPNDFFDVPLEPIKVNDGTGYFVKQIIPKERICPYCGSNHCHIQDHDIVTISCTINKNLKEYLLIQKTRYKCLNCHKTFTIPIFGLDSKDTITKQVKSFVVKSFLELRTFSQIAQDYNLSVTKVVNIFDDSFPFVPRKPLPKTLCIDEKKFKDGNGNKYCCILYDYDTNEVVDVLRNRQLPYLIDYFSNIPTNELRNVNFFVSDMYDAYSTIHRRFFPDSVHIIDLFHIIKQLTEAVNSLRISAMKNTFKSSYYYNFMKSHWKLFLCRKEDIPNKFFRIHNSASRIHYDDILFDCVSNNPDLLLGYNILQDFFHYYQKSNFSDALDFIIFISNRCSLSSNEQLQKVGYTFYKWKFGIANTLSRSSNLFHPSNSIAESTNNHIETLIRISYGLNNFDRFRKRILILRSYKNYLK